MRLRSAIDEFGGAILSDPVGTGKTFTAIAVAHETAMAAVVAPAVLRDMWTEALGLCERSADFISFESLSRCSAPKRRYDFVIVDEAHHARTPLTKRFLALSQLVANTPVLLLTATPIHNRQTDLTTLISLFHGERAEALSPAELTRLLVRRDELSKSIPGMPLARPMTKLRVPENLLIPELLLSLPPPLPVRGGGDGGALVAHSLIRQWASSDAALIGGLKRRLVRGEALSAALADGTHPSRAELSSWIAGENDIQLSFAEFLAPSALNTAEMLKVVNAHTESLRSALDTSRRSRSDYDRANLIRNVRCDHPGKRIVAFSQYADTVEGLFRIIGRDGKAGALTGAGARVTGGAISRSDAIAAFAPRASSRKPPRVADEITLLLTTDLLSEGVNLQDAGVVIHIDLPWTPARMEQRLGRVARIGSLYDSVESYTILPPVSAEYAISLEAILRSKIEQASVIVRHFPALTGFDIPSPVSSAPQLNESIRAGLSRWISDANQVEMSVAAVNASAEGFLAVVEHRGAKHTVAKLGESIGNTTTLILECVQAATSVEASVNASRVMRCEQEALAWIESHHALPASRESPIRNLAAAKVNRVVADARAFQRMRIAQKAETAFALLAGNLGACEESLIASITRCAEGERFLDKILAIRSSSDSRKPRAPKLLAMLMLVREQNRFPAHRKAYGTKDRLG
jgi:hypothetical protein